MTHDPINHPTHYDYGGRIQPVDAIEVWGLHWPREIAVHLAHVVPYVARCGRKALKGDARAAAIEDLRKAKWWIDRAIDRLANGPGEEPNVR